VFIRISGSSSTTRAMGFLSFANSEFSIIAQVVGRSNVPLLSSHRRLLDVKVRRFGGRHRKDDVYSRRAALTFCAGDRANCRS
jgi:hypothetical protein